MTFKERFLGVKTSSGALSAPSTIGAPVFTNQVDYSVFTKSDEERGKILTAKKAHNKRWRKLFGSKRVSAGIVKIHFERAVEL